MSREKMLLKLSAAQFGMWEMRVYLDTHTNCPQAEKLYKKYSEEYKVLKADYEAKYGPITLSPENSDEWLKDPWPWDND